MTSGPQNRVVLYVDSLKIGGAERITLTFARWFAEQGWATVVLTRQGVEGDFYPIPRGVERVVEPPEPLWLRRLGRWGFPWRVLRLRSWLRDQTVHLVVGMTTKPAVKLLLAAHPLEIPAVISERNYPPLKQMTLPWGILRRLTYQWAALHLVQTRATGAWLERHLGARPQLLLPNPVQWPLHQFSPALDPHAWLQAQGIANDAPILLAAGTKSHQKGFDRLVKALVPLTRRCPDLQLVILGLDAEPYHGVNQQKALHRLLRKDPDAASHLHFPGRVGNIADWYERSRFFLLPSRYEGFPNVLLEAMASGCVCLATDCPHGPADLIADGRNGILLPLHASTRVWVDTIAELLEDPERCRQLADQALQVRQRYSEASLRDHFLEAVGPLVSPPVGG